MSDSNKFVGIDMSLETSLFEYGIVCQFNESLNEYFCLYKVTEDIFDWGYKSVEDCDKLVNGSEWMSSDDITSFLEFNGTSKEDWLNQPIHQKIHNLYSYYGYENIFGTCYQGLSKDFIIEEYGKDLGL